MIDYENCYRIDEQAGRLIMVNPSNLETLARADRLIPNSISLFARREERECPENARREQTSRQGARARVVVLMSAFQCPLFLITTNIIGKKFLRHIADYLVKFALLRTTYRQRVTATSDEKSWTARVKIRRRSTRGPIDGRTIKRDERGKTRS